MRHTKKSFIHSFAPHVLLGPGSVSRGGVVTTLARAVRGPGAITGCLQAEAGLSHLFWKGVGAASRPGCTPGIWAMKEE